jgi:hypothetical protein
VAKLPNATAYHLQVSDKTSSAPVLDPYVTWRQALGELTRDHLRFAAWRERRYTFAHRVGKLLVEAHPPAPVVTGPALYGVYVAGCGLCYIGQTQDAWRRLRDLPIGESHHLAATVPPELWTRVIVVHWTELLGELAPVERNAATEDKGSCGKALEYLLHRYYHPVINCYTRTVSGTYRERSPERSMSKAARDSKHFSELFETVLTIWSEFAVAPSTCQAGDTGVYERYGRAIFPFNLLENLDFVDACGEDLAENDS